MRTRPWSKDALLAMNRPRLRHVGSRLRRHRGDHGGDGGRGKSGDGRCRWSPSRDGQEALRWERQQPLQHHTASVLCYHRAIAPCQLPPRHVCPVDVVDGALRHSSPPNTVDCSSSGSIVTSPGVPSPSTSRYRMTARHHNEGRQRAQQTGDA
jgi:hypothetical protein